MSQLPSRTKRHQSDEHWIPLSDLMTGLMMVFMLIAVAFMIQVKAQSEKVEEQKKRAEEQALRMRQVAVIYSDLREQLYNDLMAEFRGDLSGWGAEIDRDLAVRFKEPDVLFESQKADLKPRFVEILARFFPRYLKILSGEKYRDAVEEIRIEGHTSSNWIGVASVEKAYMLNMGLSQDRTRAVLQNVLSLPRGTDLQAWLIGHLTANGLASSKPRLNQDGSENKESSRRVEFRVRTNADTRLGEILKAGN